ncbi:MAG: OB-fold nucleic acid binding domain-containing protein [Candidatus Bathyarchaeia archaeon]
MNLDEITGKILKQRQDLSQNALQDLIEKKKADAQGLLSDEGAARLVAQDLDVKIDSRSFSEIKITDLVCNLNDVTVKGRVIAQWPIQEFRRRDGTLGKLFRFILADKTGAVRCLVWDGQAEDLAARGLEGQVVRLAHWHTRSSRIGSVELSCNERSEIAIITSDRYNQEYPDLQSFLTRLDSLRLGDEVNISGIIDSPPKITSFVKEQREGTVLRAIMRDQEIAIGVVAWDYKAQELSRLKKGDVLQIIGGRVKADLSGNLEVHIGANTITSILEEKPPYLKLSVLKHRPVSSLKPNDKDFTLLVKVINVGGVREYVSAGGQASRYRSLLAGDSTGLIRLHLWDEKLKLTDAVREGDILMIEGGQVRERAGEVFISLGSSGKLAINPESVVPVPVCPNRTLVSQLADLSRPVVIEGTVIKDVEVGAIQVRSGESVKVATVILDDGSGVARLSLWRELAEKARGLRSGTKVRFVGVQPRLNMQRELVMSSTNLTTMEILEGTKRISDEGDLISNYF